jgi:hypothetical protein
MKVILSVIREDCAQSVSKCHSLGFTENAESNMNWTFQNIERRPQEGNTRSLPFGSGLGPLARRQRASPKHRDERLGEIIVQKSPSSGIIAELDSPFSETLVWFACCQWSEYTCRHMYKIRCKSLVDWARCEWRTAQPPSVSMKSWTNMHACLFLGTTLRVGKSLESYKIDQTKSVQLLAR